MARVIDVRVTVDAFVLGVTTAETGARVYLEEPVTGEGVVPTVEVRGVEPAAFEATAADDPTAGSLERVAGDDDRVLYRTGWSGADAGGLGPITAAEGTVLAGEGGPDGWGSPSGSRRARASRRSSRSASRAGSTSTCAGCTTPTASTARARPTG